MNERGRMSRGDYIENMLVAHASRNLSRPRWWQRAWGRVLIGGGAFVVLGSTAVAGVMLLDSAPVTDTTVVQCLSKAGRNLDGLLSGSAVSIASPSGVLPIDDAVGTCRQMWASGLFEAVDPLDPSPTPGLVPEAFTMCVTDDGIAAVVPGRIECSVLKLHPWKD